MTDHATAIARLAQHKPIVCFAMPNWTVEILLVLVVLMGLATLATLGQLLIVMEEHGEAQELAGRWMDLALRVDSAPAVRLEPDGVGFKCQTSNIRREWERAVAVECQVLGGLLQLARTAQ